MKNKQKENRIFKYLQVVISIVMLVLMVTTIGANAFVLNTDVKITSKKGWLPIYLKKGNMKILTAYTYTNIDGKEVPVHCLEVDKRGVGEEGFTEDTVTLEKLIDNVGVYRAIINGYPYKSLEELGVKDKYEAFAAMRQAIYSMLYGRQTSEYSGVNTEAGQRTYKAYCKIVNAARSTNAQYVKGKININELSDWKFNENTNRVEKEWNAVFSHKGSGSVEIQSNAEGIELLNADGTLNKSKTIKNKETYRLSLPIENLKKDGEIKLRIKGRLKTLPVIFGKTHDKRNQNVAITGIEYEGDIVEDKIIPFSKNNTRIELFKQDGKTGEPLAGVKFEFVNLRTNEKRLYVTDDNGMIYINNLMLGEYYFKEVETLEGYSKYPDKIKVIVDKYNGKTKVVVKNNLTQVNEKESHYQSIEVENKEEVYKENKVVASKIIKKYNKLPITGY